MSDKLLVTIVGCLHKVERLFKLLLRQKKVQNNNNNINIINDYE